MRGEENVSFTDRAAGGDLGGDVLIEEVAIELGHAVLGTGLPGEHRVQADHHGETREVLGHHRTDAGGVGAEGVVVEGAGGVEHFLRELAARVEELLVLIEANAGGEAVDGLPLGGRCHHELVGVDDEGLRLRRDLDGRLPVRDVPGLLHREVMAVKLDGSRERGAGESHGDGGGDDTSLGHFWCSPKRLRSAFSFWRADPGLLVADNKKIFSGLNCYGIVWRKAWQLLQ